jgi:3-oxoacyl-(acyl-carrier-protein) synthase
MIHAAAWYCPQHCGFVLRDGRGRGRPAPDSTRFDYVASIVKRPVPNYSRMTAEDRYALCAASLALEAAPWHPGDEQVIGVFAAGFAGCIDADSRYFADYVTHGRSAGRGGLFIYTLPTSVAGEVAIVLQLRGPVLHWHADVRPVTALVDCARRTLADGQAVGMLALWSDPEAAVCLAVDADERVSPDMTPAPWPVALDVPPRELADALAASVRSEW